MSEGKSLPPVAPGEVLVVVDMQQDFVTGSLGNPDAAAIVSAINDRIHQFVDKNGWDSVYFTRDTHEANYLQTQEGMHLPIVHCEKGSAGWELVVDAEGAKPDHLIDKPCFGSIELGEILSSRNQRAPLAAIEMVGTCTDICVLSNAVILKNYLPEVPLRVIDALCAGTSKESHDRALEALQVVQVDVI